MEEIKEQVFKDLEKNNDSAEINKYKTRSMQFVANDLNCFSLVCWIEDHRAKDYADLLKKFGEWTAQEV